VLLMFYSFDFKRKNRRFFASWLCAYGVYQKFALNPYSIFIQNLQKSVQKRAYSSKKTKGLLLD